MDPPEPEPLPAPGSAGALGPSAGRRAAGAAAMPAATVPMRSTGEPDRAISGEIHQCGGDDHRHVEAPAEQVEVDVEQELEHDEPGGDCREHEARVRSGCHRSPESASAARTSPPPGRRRSRAQASSARIPSQPSGSPVAENVADAENAPTLTLMSNHGRNSKQIASRIARPPTIISSRATLSRFTAPSRSRSRGEAYSFELTSLPSCLRRADRGRRNPSAPGSGMRGDASVWTFVSTASRSRPLLADRFDPPERDPDPGQQAEKRAELRIHDRAWSWQLDQHPIDQQSPP